MKIYLLTHKKEYKRSTNSGVPVINILGELNAVKILWERKNPDKALLHSIKLGHVALVYKDLNDSGEDVESEDNKKVNSKDISGIEEFIILDGTWQEARKIYNKSPYLHGLKKVSLSRQKKSEYNIRRNQKFEGLCTAECVIELLNIKGKKQKADSLETAFHDFLKTNISRVVVLSSDS